MCVFHTTHFVETELKNMLTMVMEPAIIQHIHRYTKRLTVMAIDTILTPNEILMTIDPKLTKHELLVALILINGCCQEFYKKQTTIWVNETYVFHNILLTQPVKLRFLKTIGNLSGKKLLCGKIGKPEIVLFEKIEKSGSKYIVDINKHVRKMFNDNYSLLNCNVIVNLCSVNRIKFYCLMKRWSSFGNYHCYINWLKWYLSYNRGNKYFFRDCINPMIEELKEHGVLVKLVKCSEPTDKRLITKLIFNIFDK